LESLTLAILRIAELGFLGVWVLTAVQTPRFCGEELSVSCFFKVFNPFCSAGDLDFFTETSLPFLTS
jgi:hypothetical protein